MLTRETAIDIFDRRRQAWLAEDLDGYLGFFTDDVVMEMPRREPIHGMADYRALVERSLAMVRPVSFEYHALAVDGDCVLAEWTQAHEVRTTGRQLRYRGMSWCRIVDGRIAEWREYYDPSFL